MNIREKLTQKRANYARSLEQCDRRVAECELAVQRARDALESAREARAAAQQGLQVLDETLMDLPPEAPQGSGKPVAAAVQPPGTR